MAHRVVSGSFSLNRPTVPVRSAGLDEPEGSCMKKFLLWLVMVAVAVAVLLGGTIGAMYYFTGEDALPDSHPTLGETALEPNGYEWSVPILGGVVSRPFTSLTNLTVQKLGDFGDTVPALTLPEWVSRSDAVLTDPTGATVVQGDAAAFSAYNYAQNGEYTLTLTLWQDGAAMQPAKADGWYQYRVSFSINLQPKAVLSSERATQGSVVAIMVTGILDGSSPSLETDLGSVWFRSIQGGYMGYIPVTYNAESGDHTMTLHCGELTQELTLTVVGADFGTAVGTAEESAPGAATEYQNAIWPLYTQGDGEKYWTGSFAAPCEYGVSASYGSTLMVDGTRSGRSTGITYAAAPGSAVTAPQTGTVVYAGTLALTGGTVVIDHGCGVKSYLFGLGNVTVQRGQQVNRGDAVGDVATEHQLIFELRIGNKSVDPEDAMDGSSGLQYREDL